MAFCSNCGRQLADGAKFCFECGAKVIVPTDSRVEQRKTVYEGEIHKCPSCGETLAAFVTVCPSCGYELRGTKNTTAIKDLANKLEQASSDNQRIVIIKNFPIPNTKEDIFEFMLLAASNFDASYHAAHLHIEDISDAWLAKAEQCYQKAKLSFGSHEDFSRIESLYLRIINDRDNQKQKRQTDERERQLAQVRATDAQKFKKSKFRIVLIVGMIVSALLCAVAFNDGKIFAGVMAVAMFILFAVALLMGYSVIKERIRNLHLLPAILAFVLVIPYFALYSQNTNPSYSSIFKPNIETIEWVNLRLGDKLPAFEKAKAEVMWDKEDLLSLNFYNVSKPEFEAYIQKCKDYGYTIDAEDSNSRYFAYNAEGYCLTLGYSDFMNENELSIHLEDPKKKANVVWPNGKLVEGVPIPKSLIGEVFSETSTSFSVYLADIEKAYFSEYVALCMANGFNVDYTKSETYFRAENKDGITLTVTYEGFNTLYIWVSK